MPEIPTMSCSISTSTKSTSLRQLLVIGDGFLTTKPETQILELSLSKVFIPVFPI